MNTIAIYNPRKVKVEIHSSSSGAGSDENLSSSDLSERSGEHENDYEDIYLVREEKTQQQQIQSDSKDGSHNRVGSISSSNTEIVVVEQPPPAAFHQEANPKRDTKTDVQQPERPKLSVGHSSPPSTTQASASSSSSSPPPPPPPPPKAPQFNGRRLDGEDDEPRGAEAVEIVEEPTLRPSDVVKGMCRSMSALSARRLNSSCSDLTIISLEETERYSGPNLVNKQRVLPFVPPSFPAGDSNNLIKPSEYLKSITGSSTGAGGGGGESERRTRGFEAAGTDVGEEDRKGRGVEESVNGPPPPPLPENTGPSDSIKQDQKTKQHQPLSAISIQDLNSVQLRRTGDKMLASKTFSAPARSMSLQCLQTEPFFAQKTDLIAELKQSRGDIVGIKKMKVEKAKTEESKEKELIMEISRQFTTTKFVEKVPEKDNTGNVIPAWKRQMLAKKAAEKAKKELEEQLLREAEEKRLQAIPQWKRQLLLKKEEAENKIRSTLYTPKVVDENKVNRIMMDNHKEDNDSKGEEIDDNNNNNKDNVQFEQSNDTDQSDEEIPTIIPWRAQLRKTNSKLNLLD